MKIFCIQRYELPFIIEWDVDIILRTPYLFPQRRCCLAMAINIVLSYCSDFYCMHVSFFSSPPGFFNCTWAWASTHLYKCWSRACQCCVGWGLGPELDSCDLGPAAPSGAVTVVTGQCSLSSAPQSPLLPGMGHGFIATTSSSADPGWCFKRRFAKNSQSRRRPLLY